MIDEVATAIATGAAGNIVAYMLNGQVDALRAQIARVFRHETTQNKSVLFNALESDSDALKQQQISATKVTDQWANRLLRYLDAHPEARDDVLHFASAPVISKTMNVGAQHNHGSGPFIGGDNYGSMNF